MFNAQIQRSRQQVKKHEEYEGVLGNGSGNPYAGRSRYWVRFPAGTDESGYTKYTAPRAIRYSGEGNILAREGVEVLVRIDPFDDAETITRISPDYPDRANFDGRLLNPNDAINQWSDVKNFIRLISRPVGGGGTSSTKINVRENPFHVDDFGEISTFTETLPATHPNLVSLIPSAGNHCIAICFFDFLANEPVVYASTAQSMSTDFDLTDYSECFAQLTHNEHIPLVAIELADAQTAVSNEDVIEDLRTWLPTPQIYGFPNPIPSDKAILIRATHQQIVFSSAIEGVLIAEGTVLAL